MWPFKESVQFGCNQCGECCRQHDIPLNHFDVARLSRANISLEVIGLYPTTHEDLEGLLLYDKKHILILKKDKYTQDCLLMKDNKCSEYEARPVVCKTWPMSLSKKKRLEISATHYLLYEMACDKTPFNDHKEMKNDISSNINEYQEFRYFCRRWNSQVKHQVSKQTLPDLFQYILNEIDLSKF